MKALLNDIDDIFSRLEESTFDNVRKDEIEYTRKRIAFALKQADFDGQILCIHSNQYMVPGVFGGTYCNDCGEKIE